MSKKTALGMCAARYSSKPSRFSAGRYQVPSTTTRPGSRKCSASKSVETSQRLFAGGGLLILSPSLHHVRQLRLCLALKPGRHRQLLLSQEGGIEQLRLVARAVVGQDRHDRVTAAELLGEPDRAGDIDAGRATQAQTLVFQKVEDHRYRFFVWDDVRFIDLDVLDHGRDAAEADAFGDGIALRNLRLAMGEEIVHGRAFRVGAADQNVLVFLAQKSGDARERAAGADRANEGIDLAFGLLPDFRAGRKIMRLAVIEIVPLIGE